MEQHRTEQHHAEHHHADEQITASASSGPTSVSGVELLQRHPASIPERSQHPDDPELGATTAEYGIVMLAAVGFAGLLVVILKSGEVRELLMNIIETALSTG